MSLLLVVVRLLVELGEAESFVLLVLGYWSLVRDLSS
jgi:hypothetical protein